MDRLRIAVASFAAALASLPARAEPAGESAGAAPALGWRSPAEATSAPAVGEPLTPDARSPYVTGMIGSSFASGAGDGVGSRLVTGEGALGVSIPRPLGAVRLEVEGRQRAALSGTRPSASPAGEATVGGEWTTMANAWRDVAVADHLALYAGGGLGAGGFTHDADAAGPAAATRVTAFGWQVGGGAAYAVTDRLTLDVGGRFYGLEPAAGGPSGGPPAAEVLFAVRIAEPFSGWLGR